jgi:hypothetical protein
VIIIVLALDLANLLHSAELLGPTLKIAVELTATIFLHIMITAVHLDTIVTVVLFLVWPVLLDRIVMLKVCLLLLAMLGNIHFLVLLLVLVVILLVSQVLPLLQVPLFVLQMDFLLEMY